MTSSNEPRNDAPIRLSLKENFDLPLEADALSPDILGELSRDEIGKLPVLLGNGAVRWNCMVIWHRLSGLGRA